ncbi:RNA-directed DNA polymerase, eukaryota, partial [Tanacetum coccineum]
WRSWIQGSLNSGKASVLVNGSPTSEFQFHRGLKQGDPLAPFLFILIMESLHLSFNRAVEAGIFTGLRIDDALTISHLFYADDAIFIGEWSKENLKGILNILNCFSLLSGMSINLKKSHILGLGIRGSIVSEAAASLGCSVMKTPFNYLGIMVGGNMSLVKSWDETVHKLTKRLSKWKLKTLSIGGRLTLLKSVLGSTPIYNMSIFKVPKTVLNKMENLRRNFFNGIQEGDRKITWVKWHTVLAAKKFGGLGVSSFFALNRGLLAKWVWRFLSQDNSLWCQLISAIHGSNITDLSTAYPSTWNSIIKEFNYLKVQGVDVFSHCKIRIGNGLHTRFWKDLWIGDCTLSGLFPRLFALDTEKDISVAGKLQSPLVSSFRRNVRGGIEEQQLEHLVALLDSVILSNSNDRWVSDLNGDGVFRVKDVRNLLDEFFLPRADIPTRWVKNIPIKVNIFAWKLALDRLPTRANLVQRNVVTESQSCPLCDAILEDTSHLFFNCSLARDVTRLLCHWGNLGVQTFSSYAEWLVWFNSVRLASNLKVILEGVFYVTWWSLWNFRNQLLFASKKPRKVSIFDDIVLRSFCWCKARAPGPDDFTFGFYRRFWKVIENDVFDAVNHFFTYGDIPKGCNSSFIALIPKIPDANVVKDFRPISLIGSLYKIIAKILANRLVVVLGDIVNEVQSAFIADRQILDGPFILNEVLQWCKSKKKQSLIFKVDFEKAYDSVRCDFLDEVFFF